VSELVEVVGDRSARVSRQLALLQDARFVAVRPEGRRDSIRFDREPFQSWTNG